MAWDGYFVLDGTEFINVARTEAYAADQSWFRAAFKADDLPAMLGDAAYVTPDLDGAPWLDPDVPESGDFFGFYPLEVTGIENSTRTSEVVESTQHGGVPGRIRHATKSVVFNGLLLGSSEKAVVYGMAWLRRVLLGNLCVSTEFETGLGVEMNFLSAKPTGSSEADLTEYRRTLRKVVVNSGPTITSRRTIESCGGEVWTVTFSAVAGDPYLYGADVPILNGYLDGGVEDPWAPGAVEGTAEATASEFTEVVCGEDTWEPLYDPLCPPMIAPPAPPSLPLGCLDLPETWDRYKVVLPSENVPLWGTVVPRITLYALATLRNVRIRFYDDPTASFDPDEAPCDFAVDMVVSYLPAEATMTIDAASREVWVETVTGARRRADALVVASDSSPFEWPVLSCGNQQVITIDTEVGSSPPIVDLSLLPRVV